MKKRRQIHRRFKHNIIAIVYDFDGTLSPRPMQEYTILPQIGIRGKRFWEDVAKHNERIGGEAMITYMMRMVDLARQTETVKITRKDLKRQARNIRYFPGVVDFFTRINRYVERASEGKVRLRHYLVSAGLKEILDGTPISKYFRRIYASEYHYDQWQAPLFPKIVVTDTVKTQFLFRINKGREELSENVNEHMDPSERPIPFSNILYIGDGLSDVPSMTVTMKNRGYAIAVYNGWKGLNVCKGLWDAQRVDFFVKADYRERSDLTKTVKTVLDTMIQGIKFREAQFRQFLKVS